MVLCVFFILKCFIYIFHNFNSFVLLQKEGKNYRILNKDSPRGSFSPQYISLFWQITIATMSVYTLLGV